MAAAESIPVIGWLITWYKSWRDEKRSEPLVTVDVEILRDSNGGTDIILVVRTDVPIISPTGTYKLDSNLEGYRTEESPFSREAIYSGDPLREKILHVKVIPSYAFKEKKVQMAVPISLAYKLKTGESRKRDYYATLEIGNDKFKVT